MYRKRLRGYSANAYQIIPSVDNTTPSADIPTENTIFNGMDFSTTFIQDLHNAKHSILVMTSSIQSDKAQDTLACLLEKQRKGCIVQVFTKDIIQEAIVTQLHLFNSSPLDELSVTIHESVYFQCTIIDRHTIWYGDINFFATNTKHHFSMRLTDSTIAEQIINLIV